MITISFTVIGLVIALWLYTASITMYLFVESFIVKDKSRKQRLRGIVTYDLIVVVAITVVLKALVLVVKYLP
ncbi:hypothetical protein [Mammaliicoccus sp. JADD-157]|uniref:hypothetical protein n=1 Tax=Mammaliicoccus sp. JADD-157 TaxID=3404818 RepID=UPI003BB77430